MNNENFDVEKFGEFKGSTNEALKNVFHQLGILTNEIKNQRKDIDSLKQWRIYLIGIGTAIGTVFGLLVNFTVDFLKLVHLIKV